MESRDLERVRILIVEDNYLVASTTAQVLESCGASVVGMHATCEDAICAIGAAPGSVDVALLDVNLGEEMSYPVAEVLVAQGVPFIFATGYDRGSLDARFSEARVCSKPYNMKALINALGEAAAGARN